MSVLRGVQVARQPFEDFSFREDPVDAFDKPFYGIVSPSKVSDSSEKFPRCLRGDLGVGVAHDISDRLITDAGGQAQLLYSHASLLKRFTKIISHIRLS